MNHKERAWLAVSDVLAFALRWIGKAYYKSLEIAGSHSDWYEHDCGYADGKDDPF